jgi:hypothetical protein
VDLSAYWVYAILNYYFIVVSSILLLLLLLCYKL